MGLALMVLAAPLVLMFPAVPRAAENCPLTEVVSGDPMAPENFFLLAFAGRAWGETFVARDTLIEAITVWRWPDPATNVTPVQLFLTETTLYDSIYGPSVNILLFGPVLVVPYSDGIHPAEYRFVLDPPFALPKSGHYFFCVKEATCVSGLPFVVDSVNSYPDGTLWKRGPTVDCYGLGSAEPAAPNRDLVFRIEFCAVTTPAKRQTWGQLKVRHR